MWRRKSACDQRVGGDSGRRKDRTGQGLMCEDSVFIVITADKYVTNILENWVLELSRCHAWVTKNRTKLSPFFVTKS